MMKLCLIGPNKPENNSKTLIDIAKKYFDVEVIPISKLALIGDITGSAVKYDLKDLSYYDAILVKVPKYKYYFAKHILKNIDRKVARVQNSRSFRIISSRLSLYQTLNAKGVITPANLFAEDSETVEKNLKNLKFERLFRALSRTA